MDHLELVRRARRGRRPRLERGNRPTQEVVEGISSEGCRRRFRPRGDAGATLLSFLHGTYEAAP